MPALDALGDPVRRRMVELLAAGELPAGDVVARIGAEFGISQPAVSQHLKVLREHGIASARVDGARRIYSVDPRSLRELDAWLQGVLRFWQQPLDALDTELARGRRARRDDTTKGHADDDRRRIRPDRKPRRGTA